MEIVTLPEGVVADIDQDCISIEPGSDGRFYLTGSVLSGDVSVAFGPTPFDSVEAARAEGIAWASGHGAQTLFVTTTVYEPGDDADVVA